MRQESSALNINSIFVNTEPYRGSTGPTGPTGPQGQSGPVGNIGPRGTGVSTIIKNGSDGITVTLTDLTKIDVSGLSGNTFIDYSSVSAFYSIAGSTGVIINQSFEIKGAVQGLTAKFKPVYFFGGVTADYSGLTKDVKISGIIGATIKVGEAGNILMGISNDVVEGFNTSLFKYEENTVGITTVPVLKAKLNSFMYGLWMLNNKNVVNVHRLESVTDSNLGNIISGNTLNVYFPRIVFDANKKGITMITTLSTSHAKIKSGPSIKKIEFIDSVAPSGITKAPYSIFGYGSCCYCDNTGKKRCRDFVDKTYCETSTLSNGLGGKFSFKSCDQRKTSDCTAIAKCCINGICLDLELGECARLGGTSTPGSFCVDKFGCP